MQRKQSSATVQIERQSILSELKSHNISDNGLYIVVVSGESQNITIKWFLQLLQKPKHESGGHFTLERIVSNESAIDETNSHIILQVSAHNCRLNISADAIELRQWKEEECNTRVFHVNDSNIDSDHCLTYSEKQRVLLYEMESLHSIEKGVLFGYPNVKLYPGQSIIQVCQRENIVSEYFPLHDYSALDQLKNKWCFTFNKQPIHDIRNYFGEKIAFYFGFLEFYTNSLLVPGILGIFQCLFLNDLNIFCAIFNMLWIIIFLKKWKRKSNEFAYQWGTIGDVLLEGPRPTFRGKHMETDPITRNLTPVYPIYKTWLREYGISLPIVLLSLGAAFHIMCLYFRLEEDLLNFVKPNPSGVYRLITLMPGVIYALIVMIMNHIYRKLATKLNEWENHRTQTSHENHWIIKLVLFEFVNNFMSLFYIGFYLKDLQMLKWQLGTMLIVNQLVDNIQEVLIPLITTYRINKAFEISRKKSDLLPAIARIYYQKRLPHYEGTYYDYLELYVQFGYVFLFSSIFPLAPIIAFLNNFIEIRSDSIKLCYGFKRPHQRSANAINGAWMKAFEVMSIISVITNCALLSLSPTVTTIANNLSIDCFHLMFAFEHFILGLILIITYVVPDMPKHVNVALIKQKYDNRVIKLQTGTFSSNF